MVRICFINEEMFTIDAEVREEDGVYTAFFFHSDEYNDELVQDVANGSEVEFWYHDVNICGTVRAIAPTTQFGAFFKWDLEKVEEVPVDYGVAATPMPDGLADLLPPPALVKPEIYTSYEAEEDGVSKTVHTLHGYIVAESLEDSSYVFSKIDRELDTGDLAEVLWQIYNDQETQTLVDAEVLATEVYEIHKPLYGHNGACHEFANAFRAGIQYHNSTKG